MNQVSIFFCDAASFTMRLLCRRNAPAASRLVAFTGLYCAVD